jgi:hypothetical protein
MADDDIFSGDPVEASTSPKAALVIPMPLAHRKSQADPVPRLVDDQGLPIWRVSYTLNGERRITLHPSPNRMWCLAWASRFAAEQGWSAITVGRWHGGLDLVPTAPRRTPRKAP